MGYFWDKANPQSVRERKLRSYRKTHIVLAPTRKCAWCDRIIVISGVGLKRHKDKKGYWCK